MAVYKIYEYSIYLRAQGLFIARAREVILVFKQILSVTMGSETNLQPCMNSEFGL